MPPIAIVPADMPFGERLRRGFAYPLRDAALPTCAVLALLHYVALLPSYVGAFGGMLVWAATWRYAAECMLHTAQGYADPPDVGVDETGSAGWGLTAIHLLVVALCVLAIVFFPRLLLPLFVLAALGLPAIDMALAFDGNMALALNPLNGMRIAAAFGAAYLVPVTINLLLAALILLASLATAQLPALIALPLFAFAYSYLIVLGFHLMGGMIHQRHERFGVELQAEKLVAESGQDADLLLLQQVRRLAGEDVRGATALLVGRLQDRHAPAKLHLAYRDLLRRQNLREGLLVHGQIWIAALVAGGEARRALSLVQECTEIDPDFLPDDPRNAGELAELAARSGINRLALKLCRGFLAAWPRDSRAPQIGLCAARILRDDGQTTEAAVLLGKLAVAWPDHPLHDELLAGTRPSLPYLGGA